MNDISGLITAADVPSTVTTPSLIIGRPFIDYISFHYYGSSDDRDRVIKNIHSISDNYKIKKVIQNVNAFCTSTALASVRGAFPLQMAITEANLTTDQSTVVDANPDSFIRGQWWADFASICIPGAVQYINYWSLAEGDFGAINSAGTKRSTYHHFKMMADNFKGMFYQSTSVNVVSVGTPTNVKAFAAKSGDRVAVMILNQANGGGSQPFKVRLTGGTAPTNGLDITFNIPGLNTNAAYTSSVNIEDESTVLLLFNCKGQFAERWDYKITHANANQGPQKTETGVTLLGGQLSFAPTTTTIQSGGSATFTFSPTNYTWSWQSSCGPVSSTNNGAFVTFTACGASTATSVYTFTVTDNLGCSTSQNVNVGASLIVGTGFNPYVGSITSSSCGANNGGASVNVGSQNGNCSTSWDGGPYADVTFTVGLSPGLHQVKVKAAPASLPSNSIVTINFSIPIAPGTQPPINAGSDKYVNPYCTTTLIALPNMSASNYTYTWYKGTNTLSIANTYSVGFTVWGSDNYTVKVKTPAGCFNSDDVFVNAIYPRCRNYVTTGPSQLPCPPTGAERVNNPTIETVNSLLVINSDQFVNKIFKVTNSGKLVIKDCELSMSVNSKIQVQPGGQLVISNAYLHGCGGFYFWEGISVEGNNNDPYQLSVTESVLADAVTIIKTDKTRGILIEDNTFYNGTTAIDLDRNKDFKITKNDFYSLTYGIKTTRTPIADVRSLIKENNFENVKIGIYFDNDNHGKLDVLCNRFKNYTDYAILSNNTLLKDQGDITNGTANTFTSSSTQLNHQFRHNGNSMKYYYDPSNPLNLTMGAGLTAIPQMAGADGSCMVNENSRMTLFNNSGSASSTSHNFSEINFQAFPNPFSDKLTIAYRLPANAKTAELRVIEAASGRLIYTAELKGSDNKLDLKLDVASGLYVCQITADNGESKQFKLVHIK